MKKMIALILVAVIAFALCGCGGLANLKNVELPPLPDASAQQAEPTPIPTAEIDTSSSTAESTLPQHVIVSMESHAEQHFDPQNGETLILSFSYDTPRVYIEGRDAAMSAINEYIATLDETYYTGNDYGVLSDFIADGAISGVNAMLEAATDNYAYAVENGLTDVAMEFSSSRTARVERIDSRVLSLVYNTNTFTGGAHGNYSDLAYNFDTESGERITLESLSADSAQLINYFSEYLINIIKLYNDEENTYYSERIYPDLDIDGDDNPIAAIVRDGAWYFNNEGIVFFAQPYEIGPYASGIVKFTVPYEELVGVIDDKYFLPVHDTEPGALELKAQSEVEDGSIEIIDKLTVDENGEALCLEAVGTVYDLRISQVDYIESFYETARLWAASYMSDCVLQLETLIPDGLPKLMVSYRDATGVQTKLLLTQSGENGAYILMNEADIAAVG